jgi:hypothetical protein
MSLLTQLETVIAATSYKHLAPTELQYYKASRLRSFKTTELKY